MAPGLSDSYGSERMAIENSHSRSQGALEEGERPSPGVRRRLWTIGGPSAIEEGVRSSLVDVVLKALHGRLHLPHQVRQGVGDARVLSSVEAQYRSLDRGDPVCGWVLPIEDDTGAQARLQSGEAKRQPSAHAEAQAADPVRIDFRP